MIAVRIHIQEGRKYHMAREDGMQCPYCRSVGTNPCYNLKNGDHYPDNQVHVQRVQALGIDIR